MTVSPTANYASAMEPGAVKLAAELLEVIGVPRPFIPAVRHRWAFSAHGGHRRARKARSERQSDLVLAVGETVIVMAPPVDLC